MKKYAYSASECAILITVLLFSEMATRLGRGWIVSLSRWTCRTSFSVLESWGFTDKHWEFLVELLLLPEVNILNYMAYSFIQINILVMLYTIIYSFIMKLYKYSGRCVSELWSEVGKIESIILVHTYNSGDTFWVLCRFVVYTGKIVYNWE